MNKNEFRQELESLKAYRETRMRLANTVLEQPELYPVLLNICYEFDNETSSRACWILEFVSYKKLEWLFPYIHIFVENLNRFTLDSSIRPIAKINQILVQKYFKKGDGQIKTVMTSSLLETIAEVNFDWMISQQKVAVKAYAMRTLFLLGKKFDWIHGELTLTLEKDYEHHSAAYKAAARDILSKINKS